LACPMSVLLPDDRAPAEHRPAVFPVQPRPGTPPPAQAGAESNVGVFAKGVGYDLPRDCSHCGLTEIVSGVSP
jgi:hypothetical protein